MLSKVCYTFKKLYAHATKHKWDAKNLQIILCIHANVRKCVTSPDFVSCERGILYLSKEINCDVTKSFIGTVYYLLKYSLT